MCVFFVRTGPQQRVNSPCQMRGMGTGAAELLEMMEAVGLCGDKGGG